MVEHTDQRHEAIRRAKADKSGPSYWFWGYVEFLPEIPEVKHQWFLLLTTLLLELLYTEDNVDSAY